MAGHEEQEIAIVGAGVAGLGTALALHRIGVKSLVLEQAGNLRTAGAAFVMWPNAWTALESLGVANLIRPYFYQLDRIQGVSISRSFKSREIPLVDAGREARCIERSFLLETLKKALPADTVRYGCKLKALESHPESGRTILKFADGSKVSAKLMIGCDGIYSAVGRWLGLPPAKSTGRCAYRGMARLPQEKQGKKKLMLQMMHKGVRAGKLHCRDNLFYWFLTTNLHPSDDLVDLSSDAEKTRRSALEKAEVFPAEVLEMIKESPRETLNVTELKTRIVWPWNWDLIYREREEEKKCVAVVGDAFHPVMPDLGQGACLALEDAVELVRCVAQACPRLERKVVGECLREFRMRRVWRILGVGLVAVTVGKLQEGREKWLRMIRDWFVLPLLGLSYLLLFMGYSCAPLPSPCAHEDFLEKIDE